jgi:putative aldouronate transport system permease protein
MVMEKKKLKPGDIVFHSLNYTFFTLFMLICIYPFYYIFLYSFSNPKEVAKGVMWILPKAPTLLNYQQLLKVDGMFSAFVISTSRTIVGTVLTIFATGLFAFVIIKPNLPFRKFFYRATIVSMYINAGIIPWYVTMMKYGLKNNFLLYIIPGMISAFYLVLIKTYMESIPASLEESALIDGAGIFTIYFKIYFPVCLPVFAAVAVYSAAGHWNSWYDNFMLVNNSSLDTLQYKLLTVLNQADSLAQQIRSGTGVGQTVDPELLQRSQNVTPTGLKMTMAMIVTIPILLVYPFLQRYFVKGILIGAIKG